MSDHSWIILVLVTAGLSLFLSAESIWIRKARSKIPLRICVTGSRGKSSVTRLIASILQEHGVSTLGKVTGTRPVMILPDRQEIVIARSGIPSILEQIRVLLRYGVATRAQALVAEIMSIQPENQKVESLKILRPQITVITNIRLDHIGVSGHTRSEIAKTFLDAVPPHSLVIIPEDEWTECGDCEQKLREKQIRVEMVLETDGDEHLRSLKDAVPYPEFSINLLLADRVAQKIGIEATSRIKGVQHVIKDAGTLEYLTNKQGVILINAFSANDPVSTRMVLEKALHTFPIPNQKIVGLLCLRKDKPERTLQWKADMLNSSMPFHTLYLMGDHAHALQNGLSSSFPVVVLKEKDPHAMLDKVMEHDPKLVFGFGNREGCGDLWVKLWKASSQESP